MKNQKSERTCRKCGACCKNLLIEIFESDLVLSPSLRPFANAKHKFPEDTERIYSLPSPCPMLNKKGQCDIYLTRPGVCRGFTPNSRQCRMARQMSDKRRKYVEI